MTRPDAISAVPGIALTDYPDKKAEISAEMMSVASNVGFFYVTGKHSTPDLKPPVSSVGENCAVQGMGLRKLTLTQHSR